MSIHEDSIPFSYTPDGLDESTIDALLGEAFVQVNDAPVDLPTPMPERPVRRRANRRAANGKAA